MLSLRYETTIVTGLDKAACGALATLTTQILHKSDIHFRFFFFFFFLFFGPCIFIIEERTDQRNAQINFSLINLLLFKLLRHVSATQLEPSSRSLKSLQVTSHCNLLGY